MPTLRTEPSGSNTSLDANAVAGVAVNVSTTRSGAVRTDAPLAGDDALSMTWADAGLGKASTTTPRPSASETKRPRARDTQAAGSITRPFVAVAGTVRLLTGAGAGES